MKDQTNEVSPTSIGFVRKLARNLVKKAKIINSPVKLNSIFKSLDKEIEVSGVDLGTEDGFCVGGVLINYNSSSPVVRQRFTVAHELGHILLGHNSNSRIIDFNSKNTDEKLANVFASELLVPLPFLKKENLTNESLTSLSNKYWVSKQMMQWKLISSKLDLKIGSWQ